MNVAKRPKFRKRTVYYFRRGSNNFVRFYIFVARIARIFQCVCTIRWTLRMSIHWMFYPDIICLIYLFSINKIWQINFVGNYWDLIINIWLKWVVSDYKDFYYFVHFCRIDVCLSRLIMEVSFYFTEHEKLIRMFDHKHLILLTSYGNFILLGSIDHDAILLYIWSWLIYSIFLYIINFVWHFMIFLSILHIAN